MKWVPLLMGSLAACGSVGGNEKMDARPVDSPRPIDGSVDGHSLARCNPNAAFGTPVPVDELNSATADESASLSPDELTVYFHSDRVGTGSVGASDIYVATRSSITSPFGAPAVLAAVNTTGEEQVPSITADGLFLYLDRFAPNTTGWDIWLAQRANTTVDFSAPTLVTSLNASGPVEDDNQFPLPDNSAVYFITNRNGNHDIYRAARNVGGTFDAPVNMNIPGNHNETAVAVTADELTMLYSSDDPTGTGGYDIWMVKRSTTADGWGAPTHVAELDTTTDDWVNWISADGCDIYFMRLINGRSWDLYTASRGQ